MSFSEDFKARMGIDRKDWPWSVEQEHRYLVAQRLSIASRMLAGHDPAFINEKDVREVLRVADLLIAEAEKP